MKQRTGSLVKRSSGYYVSIMIEGKRIVRALKDGEGNPVKTLQEARKAQAEFTKPFALASQADATHAILTRLEGIREAMTDKVTVAGCWQAYVASRERPQSGEATLALYSQYASVFVDWCKANVPQSVRLEGVTKEQATAFLKHLQSRVSDSTVNKYHAFMRLLYKTLVEGSNPFGKLRYLQADHAAHQALSQAQIQSLLTVTTGELNLLFHIGAYTALRFGDACLLRWESIDMDKGTITVTPRKTASRSRKVVTLPLHPVLKSRLSTVFRNGDHVMPRMATVYARDRGTAARYVHGAFVKAGIQTNQAVEGVKGDRHNRAVYGFHSLRFSMGQQLIDAGFSLAQIAQVLGHSTETMSRHYSTISDTVREKAILSLPSITTAKATAATATA